MASSKDFLNFVLEQLENAGELRSKYMFGEYGIYLNEKFCAIIADDRLMIKPTIAGRAYIKEVVEVPPYPGAKNWFLIEEKLEDRKWLCELLRITANELPFPKPKKKKV